MPIHYLIDKERRLVISTGEGQVTFKQVRTHQDQLLSDPCFDATFSQLIDMTKAMSLDLSNEEARQIASRNVFSSSSKRAFVATAAHIFGLGRLMEVYQEHSAKVDVHVFNDMDSALKWLGVGDGFLPG